MSLKRKLYLWTTRFPLTKRQQFVLSTVILTIILLLTQVVPSDFRYAFVVFLALCTYGLTAFCLREDLKGIEWATLLVLPTLYSASVALFYFLLPVRWLTRIPVAVLYAFGFYAILLTENIYNVAANRTIALLRAAHSVGFLITFLTFFLLTQIVLAFRFNPVFNALGIGVVSFLCILQALWVMELEPIISRRVWVITGALTLVMTEVAWVLSFWPSQPIMTALFIASVLYSLVGIAQQYVVDKMYKKTVIEFFLVCFVVCIVFLFTTHWRGVL